MNLERLRAKVNPEKTAVLVIDMQKEYCCEEGIFHKRGFDIVPVKKLAPRLNAFLIEARKSLKHIIHMKMVKLPALASPVANELYERLDIERTYDPALTEFYEVIPQEEDIVIPKYRYSGFVSTYLDQALRLRYIRTLIITGISTNVCVESTARDGHMRDYTIVIPSDMTEGTSDEAKKWSLLNVDGFFGEVVHSQDLLKCWKNANA